MVSENALSTHERTQRTTALDQSALLDQLAQLKLTDVPDRVRSITEALYQELIDAEAENVIGAGGINGPRTAQPNATAPGPGR